MLLNKGFLLGLACLASLIACSTPSHDHEEGGEESHGEAEHVSFSPEAYQTAGIVVAPVDAGSYVPTIQVTGALTYDERSMAIATARIGGRIAEVIADFGQSVTRGEALAWIDSPELGAAQTDYLRDRSMLQLREAEHERARLLLEGEAISRGELLRREAEWRAAEAELRTAEQKLHLLGLSQSDIEDLTDGRTAAEHLYPVRASIDGRVTERKAVPGRVVAADDELFTVARLDSLWLFLQVFEKDLHSVEEGSAVTLTCESHPNHHFRGIVDFVGQILDPHSRTVRARAVIDNVEGKLKPGMFVYASIEAPHAGEGEEGRLAIPAKAVANVDGRDVVFVQVTSRTFEPRPVVLGEASREWVTLRSGLTEGEVIAVDGVFILKSELLKGGLEEHHH